MRRLVIILTLLIFMSCDTESFNPNKELFETEISVNAFEKELNNKILAYEYGGLNNKSISFVNPYDGKSSEYILFLDEIKKMIKQGAKNTEVEVYIENKLVDFENYEISKNSDFELMEKVLSSLDIAKRKHDESLEWFIIESYEIFVSENISENLSTYHDLMGILSLQKYIFKAFFELDDNNKSNKNTTYNWNRGHRDCWDCCMWRTYREYNWVDVAKFALNPPGDVAWTGASCAWDCW